ncbi:hypothetical protein Ae201684_002218 [Aphanomyces euteiches]|uniref:Uncharacterized protein n=1 Tax=Aphanomyces euteiches TaxID=100861 RepID=A0A6G0XQJ4_9STRA|nr:hypothetical protein Ae201684_002218 [Aphanomyces euteiches]
MSLFGFNLIGYETRTKAGDEFLRANYEFLNNRWGRCLFLCMISIFPFGMFRPYVNCSKFLFGENRKKQQ